MRALGYNCAISFRGNHSGSSWCFCHEQKATKVNGAHFDDKAGTAKCCFTAIAPGWRVEWRSVWRKDGLLLLLLLPLRAEPARLICWVTHLPAASSSPSPPTHHPSAFSLHLGLGAMTGPSIISADWSLLIAIAVNCLDFAEIAHWMGRRPKEQR